MYKLFCFVLNFEIMRDCAVFLIVFSDTNSWVVIVITQELAHKILHSNKRTLTLSDAGFWEVSFLEK